MAGNSWPASVHAPTHLPVAAESGSAFLGTGEPGVRLSTNLLKAATLSAALAILLALPSSPAQDRVLAQVQSRQPPQLDARAWALVDANTGAYLAGENPHERLPVASTTNVMAALVALEEGANLKEEVTVSEQAERFVGFTYSNVGLIAGERLAVGELLEASLVPSGTDAVYALAEYLGGGGGEAGVEGFVEKANREAEDLGLEDTHFQNPAGLDARGQYSSARDLAEMAREAMKYPEFREIVGKTEAAIGTQNRQIETTTTNQLLYDYEAATGVKTGTSAGSGPCVVASAERGDESYIAVVLGASGDLQRFEAARTTLEYGFEAYDRRPLVDKGNTYETLTLPYRSGETVGLAAARDVPGSAGPGLELKKRIIAGKAPAEVRAGQKLGTIEVFVDGQSMGTSPLVANRGYGEASPWQRAQRAGAWPAERLWATIGGWISKRVADTT